MGVYSDLVLSLNPTHYYRMGESGGSVMTDEMGAINLAYGATTVLGNIGLLSDGDVDTSAVFDGAVDQQIDIASLFTGIIDFSLSYFFSSSTVPISEESTMTGSGNYFINHNIATDGRFKLFYPQSGWIWYGKVVTDGLPHLIVHVVENGYMKVYLDNVLLVNQQVFADPPTPANFAVTSAFNGVLDELSVWNNTPLSTFQVEQLYQASIGQAIALDNYRDYSLSLAPYTYYRMNETTGTTLTDEAGNINKTLSGAIDLTVPGLLTVSGGQDSGLGILAGNTASFNLAFSPVAQVEFSVAYWYQPSILEVFRMIDSNPTGQLDYDALGVPTGTYSNGLPALVVGEPHFYCFTRNGSGTRNHYVDGVLVGTSADTSVTTGVSWDMMSTSANAGDGIYDEMAGFPIVLTNAQISDLYKISKGINLNPISYKDLVLYHLPKYYWRLGETSGAVAVDEIGNLNGAYNLNAILGQGNLLLNDSSPSVNFPFDESNMTAYHDLSYWSQGANITILFKINSFGDASARIISIGNQTVSQTLLLTTGVNGNALTIDSYNGVTEVISATNFILGKIYHISINFNDTTNLIEVYVDGVLAVTNPAFNTAITGTLFSIAGDDNNNTIKENCDINVGDVSIFPTVLTAQQIAELYNFARSLKPYPAKILSHSPVAYYRMNDATGVVATDDSPNANNGTYANAPLLAQAGLVIKDLNNAVDFTPALSNVTIAGIVGSAEATIGLMINSTDVASINNIFLSTAIELFTDITGQFVFTDGTTQQPTAKTLTANATTHLTMTFSLSVLKLFINGKLQFTGTFTGVIDLLKIGYNATGEFKGKIDEVFLLDKVLTDREIEGVYNMSLALDQKYITGSIVENLAVTLWDIASYKISDKALVVSKSNNANGAFSLIIPNKDAVEPQFVTVLPVQGKAWKAEEVLPLNSLTFPSNPESNPYYFKVTTSGTTGTIEPIWTSLPASTVVDGTVTWTLVERLVQPITHSPIMPL